MSTLADRVKQTFSTTGTGDLTLLGAETNFQTFFEAQGLNEPTEYIIIDGVNGAWEGGIGENTTSTNFERTTVLINSAGTQPAALNLGAGTKLIFCGRSAVTLAEIEAAVVLNTAKISYSDAVKVATIASNADVTGAANVANAGALMDSELANITAVKAINQGLATTNSPTFAGSSLSGNVLIGQTIGNVFNQSSVEGLKLDGSFANIQTARNGVSLLINRITTDGAAAEFYKDGSAVGNISVTSSATAYNTSSDYRLKENVTPLVGATDRFKLLKAVNFGWIASGEYTDGFLAHQLAEVVPEAVTGAKDAMRDEEYQISPAKINKKGIETKAAVMGIRSVPDMQGIDQSKIVPLLTATIQELMVRIEALEQG